MINVDALIDAAQARSYRIRWHRGGPKAAWMPHRNTITLRVGMDDVTTLCSLAHELGHAHYSHPPGHYGAQERQADEFAARLLISPVDYALAERLHGPHPAAIAHELGVTIHLTTIWKSLYERTTA